MPARTPRLLVVVTLAEAGGAQTFAAHLASGLCGSWDVTVAAHGPRGALADACLAAGVPFRHLVHLRRDPTPRDDGAAFAELRELARELRPDVVQLNSSKAGALGRVALAGLPARVAFTAHGWAFSGRGGATGAAVAAVERTLSPLADAIVCVSRYDHDLALSRRVASARRLHVIHNGVDVPPGAPRGPLPQRPLAVCTARLAEPKNVSTLLRALALPPAAAWRLRVLGDGPRRAQLERLRDGLGLAGRVELLGERRDVPTHLAAADAFVLPTRWEGFPYSVLEAMAAGLPVVASRVGGVPEQVLDGRTGTLVEPGDADGLADALGRLAADGPRARALGAAGRDLARRRFGLRRMLDRYDALLGSLAARGARSGGW
jgi:glycosyltransferase involved in cell wall biosynthesis